MMKKETESERAYSLEFSLYLATNGGYSLASCLGIPRDIPGIFGRLRNRLCPVHRASSSAERGRASNDSCLREEITA